MDDDLFKPPPADLTASLPKADTKLEIDPKLLTKALNKMRGLVKGNGLDEAKVILVDTPETSEIKMYRFKARTSLKLIPQYSTRTVPGRNSAAEVVSGEAEFKKTIAQIATDVRTNPHKRKQMIDFLFQRTDKGFGIQDQRTKFQALNRDLVQHDKCTACANTGKLMCAKCHGKTMTPCPKCMGRRQVLCPRCRGATRIDTPKGTMPCTFCRGDGRVNCKTCGARGQVKCQNCAATGTTQCRVCAASGWISHLTHVEVLAQINFDYDRSNLPLSLVKALEKNPSRCVEKHDIEVSIVKSRTTDNSLDDMGKPQNKILTDHEPEDTIWIDYEAMSPFGAINFKIDDKDVSGYLFGFQTRLVGFPFFLEELVRNGINALTQASTERKNIRPHLAKAVKYRLMSDILAQTLWIKNTVKTKSFLKEKYATGINPETISMLVDQTDLTLRNITRLWRTIGLVIGFVIFAVILEIYFLSDGREYLKSFGLPDIALVPLDILLFPLGVTLGVFGSKFAAKWSQDKTLHKIVPADVLKKRLPKAGKTVQWSMITSAVMVVSFLTIAVMSGGPIPAWLNGLIGLTLSIIHGG